MINLSISFQLVINLSNNKTKEPTSYLYGFTIVFDPDMSPIYL